MERLRNILTEIQNINPDVAVGRVSWNAFEFHHHIIRRHFGAKNNNDWIHFIKLHKNLIIFLRIMVGIEFVARSFGNAERSQSQDSLWKFRPVHQEKGITSAVKMILKSTKKRIKDIERERILWHKAQNLNYKA